jgi:hypothetical protein
MAAWSYGETLASPPAGALAARVRRVPGARRIQLAIVGAAIASVAAAFVSFGPETHGGPAIRAASGPLRAGAGLLSQSAVRAHLPLSLRGVPGARYSLQMNPFIQQGTLLTGGGEVGEGAFGFSVALSADGNTALIGGPGDNQGHGAAWVFTRSGGGWAQQGSRIVDERETGETGAAVALSADGNTALIGVPGDGGGAGAGLVFVRSAGVWSRQGYALTNGNYGREASA